MPVTYHPIATTNVTTSVTDVTFTSISGSYTDLVLIASPISNATAGVDIFMQFNSDTGSNYSITALFGNGTSASSGRQSNQTRLRLAYNGTNNNPTLRYNIMNYSNTTTNKTIVGKGESSTNAVEATVGLWRNTSAITSIKIFASSGNITAGTFTLYGIKAA